MSDNQLCPLIGIVEFNFLTKGMSDNQMTFQMHDSNELQLKVLHIVWFYYRFLANRSSAEVAKE
jgi:hypothetical protein